MLICHISNLGMSVCMTCNAAYCVIHTVASNDDLVQFLARETLAIGASTPQLRLLV